MLGIIGAFVLLVGGCVAIVANSGNSDDGVVSVQTTVGEEEQVADGDISETETTASDDQPLGGSELSDVVSCTRVDPETIILEVVNNSPKTSSYILTIGYFDDGGLRLADETAFLNYLRPGESAVEEQFVFEDQGTVCEVIDIDRFAAESIDSELAEVSQCELGPTADALGSFQASLAATNGTPEPSDYLVEVAFVDPDGKRRGTGSAFIESVRPGESAPSDVLTTVDFAEGYACQVVAVTRNAS